MEAGTVCIEKAIGEDASIADVHKMCTSDNASCRDPRDASTLLVPLEVGAYDGWPATKVLLVPHTGKSNLPVISCFLLCKIR